MKVIKKISIGSYLVVKHEQFIEKYQLWVGRCVYDNRGYKKGDQVYYFDSDKKELSFDNHAIYYYNIIEANVEVEEENIISFTDISTTI